MADGGSRLQENLSCFNMESDDWILMQRFSWPLAAYTGSSGDICGRSSELRLPDGTLFILEFCISKTRRGSRCDLFFSYSF